MLHAENIPIMITWRKVNHHHSRAFLIHCHPCTPTHSVAFINRSFQALCIKICLIFQVQPAPTPLSHPHSCTGSGTRSMHISRRAALLRGSNHKLITHTQRKISRTSSRKERSGGWAEITYPSIPHILDPCYPIEECCLRS